MDNTKVVLGLSGGIDSAAAAISLKEKGYHVTALYFDVCKKRDLDSFERAKDLAHSLSIDFVHIDVSSEFEDKIIKPFCDAYVNGYTPMPCIMCNPIIKWAVLKDYADKIDAQYIATGHYAQVVYQNDAYYIKQSINIVKDQSYMLAMLNQDILSRIIFPLASFQSKDQVRLFLQYRGYNFANTLSESQDICFIDTDYKDFLKTNGYISKAGNFVNSNGEILGKHGSCSDYTIGQGRGFGMGFNKKMYVKSIDPNTGNVVLCEDKDLYEESINIKLMNFAKYGSIDSIPKEYNNRYFDVKIRYAAKKAKAKLIDYGTYAKLIFDEAQRAPAKGQFAVLYEEDIVIGAGMIL